MTASIRTLCCALLSAIGFALGGAMVQAASLQVSPLLVDVPTHSKIVTYTLRNTGGKPLGVQIFTFRWEQVQGEDKLTPTEELMVIPRIVSIPPGKEQLVRVALRTPRPSHELSYRLHFQELPGQTEQGAGVIQTLLKLNVPLFFSAKQSVLAYEPELRRINTNQIEVEIRNTGSRYMRVTQLGLQNLDEQTLGEISGLFYILPGTSRSWIMDLHSAGNESTTVNQFQLQVIANSESEQHLLKIP